MMARAFMGSSLFAILLAGAFIAQTASAGSGEGGYVVPGSKAAHLESCVAPTPFMRRNHMELILHQRHVTVHEGIRATKDSLSGCVACHVKYDEEHRPVPVNAEGQFCESCHELMAVDLTCFGCHATVPAHTDAEAEEEVAGEGTGGNPGSGKDMVTVAPALGADVAHVHSKDGQGVGD
jgi:hypothetical protein